MFSELKKFLESLKGTKFVWVPDPGNAGDNFISHATYQLFQRLGLTYEIGNELAIYPGHVVAWGGGGNLVSPYVNLNNFLLANASIAERIIVLPHTIRGHEDTLAKLGSNCEIWCRDADSFAHVNQHAPKARVMLSHDLAFSADLTATVKEARQFPIPLLSDRSSARRNVKRLILSSLYKFQAPKTLNCFRSDDEKTNTPVPSPNIDVSAVYATGDMSRKVSLETTYRMMRFVGGFDTVNTNRLHISILAAMLGKTVNLYDNSYGKNRAIYEHSMASRFSNVNWCG